jgi:hypothetical protein
MAATCERPVTNFQSNATELQHLGLYFYHRKHANLKPFNFDFSSVNYKPDSEMY